MRNPGNSPIRRSAQSRPARHAAGNFWVMVGILLLAFAIRIAIYGYGLPYVENGDEPNMYALANQWRGAMDAGWRNEWLEGYPPGYLIFSGLVMEGTDRVHQLDIHLEMGLYIRALRFASLSMDLLTLSLLMWLARRLGGTIAAGLAGGVWAVSEHVSLVATAALPAAASQTFVALCVVLGLIALRRQNAWLALASTGAGLVAVTFKYPLAPVLVTPMVSFLWLLWKGWRRALLPAALALLAVVLTAYELLVVYGAQNLSNTEANIARGGLLDNLLIGQKWANTLQALIESTGPILLLIAGLAMAGVIVNRRRIARWPLTLLVLLTALALLGIVPIYARFDFTAHNYVLPGALLLIPFSAVIITATLPRHRPKGTVLWTWVAVIAPVVGLAPGSLSRVVTLQRPSTYTVAQRWFEENIPDGAVLWVQSPQARRSLNRYEAGYPGFKTFNMVYLEEQSTWEGDPGEIYYLFLREEDLAQWPTHLARPPLDELPVIKMFGGPSLRGSTLYVYAPEPFTNPLGVTFQDQTTQLVLEDLTVRQDGSRIHVDSYWRAPSPPPLDYSYLLHLTPADDPLVILAQQDGQLGHRRTSTWTDPAELLRGNMAPLLLPDLPPGEYALLVGAYYWETNTRLTLDDGRDRLEVYRFRVD